MSTGIRFLSIIMFAVLVSNIDLNMFAMNEQGVGGGGGVGKK